MSIESIEMRGSSYSRAFVMAVLLHVGLFCLLFIESWNNHPALQKEASTQSGILTPIDNAQPEIAPVVKAHSVDSQAVMETLNRIKAEKAKALQVEQARQNALKKEATLMRAMREKEQQRLVHLQQEALKVAALQKKKLEEEKKHLKQIAEEAAAEKERVAVLKQQQKALEAQKLQTQKEAQAQKEASAREAVKAAQAEKEASAREAATKQAVQQAKLAGEIDKYKALIINAISQRWILPETANPQLSTQFRIRLAPNGAVLDVTLIKSSGDALLDRSAQTAIYKASPLPVPADPVTFELFRDISLTVRPEKTRG